MKDICICILAYNEQKHIANTIEAIAENCSNLNCDIKVYANGCTDGTVNIVRDLFPKIPNLYLRELELASKPNAWNTAFHENLNPFLVFSDGDVTVEAGAIEDLCQQLKQPKTVLAGCTLWPKNGDLTFGQRFVGFVQIPLSQNFLSGGCYGICREEFAQELNKNNKGIPLGVVAEDTFIEKIVPVELFTVISHKVYYEPPNLEDYCKYLARLRWQEDQLRTIYEDVLNERASSSSSVFARVFNKNLTGQGIKRLLLGITASGLRCLVKVVFRSEINKYYSAMGSVSEKGRNILNKDSRSNSAK